MKKLLYLIIMILAATSVMANADVNSDGIVDIKDLDEISKNVNLETPAPEADVNHDGNANVLDMAIVASEFN